MALINSIPSISKIAISIAAAAVGAITIAGVVKNIQWSDGSKKEEQKVSQLFEINSIKYVLKHDAEKGTVIVGRADPVFNPGRYSKSAYVVKPLTPEDNANIDNYNR